MLAKQSRLNSREFAEVFSRGRTLHSSAYMVKCLGGQESTKLGVAVSKKHYKTAVERNAMRRRVYSAAREYLDNHPDMRMYCVVVVKKEAKAYRYRDLKEELEKLLGQLAK